MPLVWSKRCTWLIGKQPLAPGLFIFFYYILNPRTFWFENRSTDASWGSRIEQLMTWLTEPGNWESPIKGFQDFIAQAREPGNGESTKGMPYEVGLSCLLRTIG